MFIYNNPLKLVNISASLFEDLINDSSKYEDTDFSLYANHGDSKMLNPSIEVAEKNINTLNLVNYFLKPLDSKLIHQNYYVRNYLENIKSDDLCSTIPPIPCPFFDVLSIEGLSKLKQGLAYQLRVIENLGNTNEDCRHQSITKDPSHTIKSFEASFPDFNYSFDCGKDVTNIISSHLHSYCNQLGCSSTYLHSVCQYNALKISFQQLFDYISNHFIPNLIIPN